MACLGEAACEGVEETSPHLWPRTFLGHKVHLSSTEPTETSLKIIHF